MNPDTAEHDSIVERKGIREWLLRTETHDNYGGLQTAIERAKQGLGTAVFCSHNGTTDMLGTLIMLKKIPEFADKEFVLPMSSILYNRGYRFGEHLLGVKFIPVHSPEVKRKHALAKHKQTSREVSLLDKIGLPKEDVLDQKPGLQQYLEAAQHALEHGGVVIVAPQAQGNMDTLDLKHPRRAFSKFWRFMEKSLDLNFSVLPIGVSFPKAADSGRPQSGMHVGEKMRIDVGMCFDRAAVSQEIETHGGDADRWIYGEIASLLPKKAVKSE